MLSASPDAVGAESIARIAREVIPALDG